MEIRDIEIILSGFRVFEINIINTIRELNYACRQDIPCVSRKVSHSRRLKSMRFKVQGTLRPTSFAAALFAP